MKGKLLGKMIQLAANAHAGQFDKGDEPYVLHCLKVMHYLKSHDEELRCIAVGHDLIEDCPEITVDVLRQAGMTQRIIEGIVALSKVPGQTYQEYKAAVFANVDAMRVKVCDLRHNTDIRRIKGKAIMESDVVRLENYYSFALEIQLRLAALGI